MYCAGLEPPIPATQRLQASYVYTARPPHHKHDTATERYSDCVVLGRVSVCL